MSNAPLRPTGADEHLLLQVENLSMQYARGARRVRLFDGLSFTVAKGQILAIVGQSGVGKSTLLHLLGALDRPTSGEIRMGKTALSQLSAQAAASFRNREVGYVWQFHYLLPEFSALENAAMPLLARGAQSKQAREEAAGWLERVGLASRLHHRAGELSGGEQQRVSLARALITRPRLLLADEPTGDLDEATAESVFDLIQDLHRERGLTTVLVTHNMALAARCHRVLRLTQDGVQEEPGAGAATSVQ